MKLRHKFFADALNDVAAGVSALNKTAAARGESNKGTIELQNMKQLTQALPEYTCGPWQLVCSLSWVEGPVIAACILSTNWKLWW